LFDGHGVVGIRFVIRAVVGGVSRGNSVSLSGGAGVDGFEGVDESWNKDAEEEAKFHGGGEGER
jgi:hypothetical protein